MPLLLKNMDTMDLFKKKKYLIVKFTIYFDYEVHLVVKSLFMNVLTEKK